MSSKDAQKEIHKKRLWLEEFLGSENWNSLDAESQRDLATAEYLREHLLPASNSSLAAAANGYCRAWEREVRIRITDKLLSYARDEHPELYATRKPFIEYGKAKLFLEKPTPPSVGKVFKQFQDPVPKRRLDYDDIILQFLNARRAEQRESLTRRFPALAEDIGKRRNDTNHFEKITGEGLNELRDWILNSSGKSQSALLLVIESTTKG